MPFLRLTRDRRGFENTFLMHADRLGERPRVLYWYRTAPGIALGRPPLDEDAIRTIEEQHPHIEFDWPAILALSEVMTPEEEAPHPKPPSGRKKARESRREQRGDEAAAVARPATAQEPEAVDEPALDIEVDEAAGEETAPVVAHHHVHGLLEELVGREIATRLRARHAEIQARIHEAPADPAVRDLLARKAEALDPDLWLTPDAILDGVRKADQLFEQLRSELPAKSADGASHSSRE